MKIFKSFSILLILFATIDVLAQQQKVTIEDLMRFRNISNSSISDKGKWVSYDVWPDRGDGEAVFVSSDGKKMYSVGRGRSAEINSLETYGAASVKRHIIDELNSKPGQRYVDSLALVRLSDGERKMFASVKRWAFSEDGKWLAIHMELSDSLSKNFKNSKRAFGTPLILKNLETGNENMIQFVHEMRFDSLGRYLAFSLADTSGTVNSLKVRLLQRAGTPDSVIHRGNHTLYGSFSWYNRTPALAYTFAGQDEDGTIQRGTLQTWHSEPSSGNPIRLASLSISSKWYIPLNNSLSWSSDAKRLFFGLLPSGRYDVETEKADKSEWVDPYNVDKILSQKEMDVWHQADPKIKTHEKVDWRTSARRFVTAVAETQNGTWKALGDETVDRVQFNNSLNAMGIASTPYEISRTWDSNRQDLYAIDIANGKRTPIAKGLRESGNLSPSGKYIAYYHNGQWFLYSIAQGTTRNLTAALNVPFYDEDHDYPIEANSYGIGGWAKSDEAIYIYDKYDIWMISTADGKAQSLTQGKGRETNTIFRIQRTAFDTEYLDEKHPLLLTGYKDMEKSYGFYQAQVGKPGYKLLLAADKRFVFRGKAKNADKVLFTQEKYNEFPDLWTSGLSFNNPQKITNEGAQLAPYNWGNAELVSWRNLDGRNMQGVLIKPDTYIEGKKYPVVVYYYRFFSQRLHEFPATAVNHRPAFPYYVSDEYLIFLPDIRFEIGRPGLASTKSLVPGVQKLIEMGVADPEKIGLHGHSWSGYQTAFIITQTDIFAAAVAGAPVSNMTSAYGGIRWESGLSRQFQYEMTQSRLGGSLWEYPERYIENSPLFFADRINTPLLIQFGDEDGAVPWYQGIELYMAMRRLQKPGIMLQYHGEGHHLQKYPNKVDYALKMKHYFDHYLKGVPAEKWITEGEAYKPKPKN